MPPGVTYPDHLRVQSVMQLGSGLPEDRVVNTWHFRNDTMVGTWQDSIDLITTGLVEFYTVAAGSPPLSIAAHLAGQAIDSWEFRGYDLGQPEPREPHIVPVSATDVALLGAGAPLPLEVAAVLSLGTDVIAPKAGTPGKRGKGRLYLGPLNVGILEADSVTGIPFVPEDFRQAALAAYERLAAYSGFTPVVLSPTYQQTDVITKVWMDDAFDTQRRRGNEPRVRSTVTL